MRNKKIYLLMLCPILWLLSAFGVSQDELSVTKYVASLSEIESSITNATPDEIYIDATMKTAVEIAYLKALSDEDEIVNSYLENPASFQAAFSIFGEEDYHLAYNYLEGSNQGDYNQDLTALIEEDTNLKGIFLFNENGFLTGSLKEEGDVFNKRSPFSASDLDVTIHEALTLEQGDVTVSPARIVSKDKYRQFYATSVNGKGVVVLEYENDLGTKFPLPNTVESEIMLSDEWWFSTDPFECIP